MVLIALSCPTVLVELSRVNQSKIKDSSGRKGFNRQCYPSIWGLSAYALYNS